MTPHLAFLFHLSSSPIFAAVSTPTVVLGEWKSDWLWSLPIIATTVVFQSFFLSALNRAISPLLRNRPRTMLDEILSVIAVGGTALCCTALLGCEGMMWAIAYRMLGAIPTGKDAMLYSLNALTSYGHTQVALQHQWQMMGALEALNGWILFGLTTAFMFNVLQAIWSRHKQPE